MVFRVYLFSPFPFIFAHAFLSVWTTASSCATVTMCLPDLKQSGMPSTCSLVQRSIVIPRTPLVYWPWQTSELEAMGQGVWRWNWGKKKKKRKKLATQQALQFPHASLYFQNCRREVLSTLTSDIGKLLTRLHSVKIGGNIDFVSCIQIAQVWRSSLCLDL